MSIVSDDDAVLEFERDTAVARAEQAEARELAALAHIATAKTLLQEALDRYEDGGEEHDEDCSGIGDMDCTACDCAFGAWRASVRIFLENKK